VVAAFKTYPVTPSRWKDVEELFGERGACDGCWCMFWRFPRKQCEAGKGAKNKSALKNCRSLSRRHVVKKMADPFLWHGVSQTFAAAGFKEVLRRSDSRPIMRLVIG
jgi:hypothetical protein